MAHERERAEWDRTAALMSWVGRLTTAKFEPEKLNPVRLADAAAGQPGKRVVSDAESDLAWDAIDRAFECMAKRG